MRARGIALAVGALLAIGCASPREAQRDSHGLVRVKSWTAGNLFAHESLSIDDYDDIWLAEIGVQYAEGQEPLAEPEEQRVRKMLHDIALEEIHDADRAMHNALLVNPTGARAAQSCRGAVGAVRENAERGSR